MHKDGNFPFDVSANFENIQDRKAKPDIETDQLAFVLVWWILIPRKINIGRYKCFVEHQCNVAAPYSFEF